MLIKIWKLFARKWSLPNLGAAPEFSWRERIKAIREFSIAGSTVTL
jgi:hypothetical protein